MEYKLKRLGRELAAPGKALEFYRDDMELPDGKIEKWDFVHHKRGGGACVVQDPADPSVQARSEQGDDGDPRRGL